MNEFITFGTHDEDYIWQVPVHQLAKIYAKIKAEGAGTFKSGLYHQAYYKFHRYAIENPTIILRFLRDKVGWNEIAPFVSLYEPEQNGLLEYEWRKGELVLGDYYEESGVGEVIKAYKA